VTRSWRARELELLLYPAALVPLGYLWLAGASNGRLEAANLGPAVVFITLMLGAHFWLCWRLPTSDQLLLPIATGLVALGLIMIARLEPELAWRQTAWVAIGIAAMVAGASLLPGVPWLKRYRYSIAGAGLALVVLTLVLGVDPNGSGARLWLGLGGLYFQPSELLKVLLVIFFAAYLDDYRELLTYAGGRLGRFQLPPLPYLAPLLTMFGLSQAILFWQRDLGAALLFFGIFLSMLYVASGRLSYVFMGGALFFLGGGMAYLAFSHVRLRVDIWLDPWPQADSAGYQVVQALMALGAGGVLGTGLGSGFPDYIPAVHTDFIIAAIGEELGLIGSLAVVALYLLFIERGFRVALTSRDSFSTLLAAGLTSVFAIQAFVILGGTLQLVPLTGITLPLVSYGGSSILANSILLGLLLRISAEGAVSADGRDRSAA
jgi:cell division protein FtsW (lipid II flippase)